jgi:hypothetical protein
MWPAKTQRQFFSCKWVQGKICKEQAAGNSEAEPAIPIFILIAKKFEPQYNIDIMNIDAMLPLFFHRFKKIINCKDHVCKTRSDGKTPIHNRQIRHACLHRPIASAEGPPKRGDPAFTPAITIINTQ